MPTSAPQAALALIDNDNDERQDSDGEGDGRTPLSVKKAEK